METAHAKELLTKERKRLAALRAQAADALADSQEGVRAELSTYDQHEADVGTDLHEVEVNQTLVETLDAELAAVDEAFERLATGTFGRCEQCGAALSAERLQAVPTARVCADHAQGTL